jgi:hypothetical protein
MKGLVIIFKGAFSFSTKALHFANGMVTLHPLVMWLWTGDAHG